MWFKVLEWNNAANVLNWEDYGKENCNRLVVGSHSTYLFFSLTQSIFLSLLKNYASKTNANSISKVQWLNNILRIWSMVPHLNTSFVCFENDTTQSNIFCVHIIDFCLTHMTCGTSRTLSFDMFISD